MYSTIYIYETFLQKSIIDYLIKHNNIRDNILIIDATNHKLIINRIEYRVNFNKFKLFIQSLCNLHKLKEEDLKCETLVSTHITGINALFLSSFINAKGRILIDDGIGTLVLLHNQNIFKCKAKYQIRFIITKLFLFFYRIKLLNISDNLLRISHYYTIYKNNPLTNNGSLSIIHLELYHRKYKVIDDETCFIGSPMIEFKLCKQNAYHKLLIEVKKKYGDFKYFLHPDEYIALTYNIEGIEFVKLDRSIEEHFFVNGIPINVISFISSAILNLANSRYSIGSVNFMYIKKRIYGKKFDEIYYKLMEYNNIKDSGLII